MFWDGNSIAPNPAEAQVRSPETSAQLQKNEFNKEENGNLSNSDVDTLRDDSQNPANNFRCTACNNVAVEVHSHPLLEVIVCIDCKRSIEDRVAKVCSFIFQFYVTVQLHMGQNIVRNDKRRALYRAE